MYFCINFHSSIPAASSSASDGSPNVGDSLEYVPEAVPTILTEPPVEDQLAWHTLWPESHKLYGHGNELVSLCCDHAGRLVASSCKVDDPVLSVLVFLLMIFLILVLLAYDFFFPS